MPTEVVESTSARKMRCTSGRESPQSHQAPVIESANMPQTISTLQMSGRRGPLAPAGLRTSSWRSISTPETNISAANPSPPSTVSAGFGASRPRPDGPASMPSTISNTITGSARRGTQAASSGASAAAALMQASVVIRSPCILAPSPTGAYALT